MDSRFIKTLLSVVDTGSFAGAARCENLTPATVSQRVRSLEAELGEVLIVRAGQKVMPTAACLSVIDRMRHIAGEIRQISTDLDATRLCGQVHVGAISTALADWVPDVLARFVQQAPKVSLNIIPGTSADLFKKLTNEEIDAAFLIKPPFKIPKSLVLTPIEAQPFVFIAQSEDKRTIDEIIATEQALIYDPNSWGGRLISTWLNQQISSEKILCELDALEAIATAIGQGLGYSIVPDWHGLTKNKSIRRIPLPMIDFYRELVLLHRRLNPEVLKLLQP